MITRVYLSFPSGNFTIPVNPKEIKITRKSDPDEYDMVGQGQRAVPQFPDISTAKFESFFPLYPETIYGAVGTWKPQEYCDVLWNAMKNAEIGELTVYGTNLLRVHWKVMIKSFDTQDKGGEPNDLYYTLEFERYLSYKPDKIVIKKSKIKKLTDEKKKDKVVKTKSRDSQSKKIRVGVDVVANGKYYYTSDGAKPFGTAKNLKTKVTRIVKGKSYPIHIGQYGWMKEADLQVK